MVPIGNYSITLGKVVPIGNETPRLLELVPLGTDEWIDLSSTAIEHGATLATFDGDFHRFSELKLEYLG